MPKLIEVKVPAIGDFKNIPIIEVLVKPGDAVKPEDALVTLESDKATLDVPAPVAGVVKEIKAKIGDKVSEGSLILMLDASEAGAAATVAPAAPAGIASPTPPARGCASMHVTRRPGPCSSGWSRRTSRWSCRSAISTASSRIHRSKRACHPRSTRHRITPGSRA